MNATEYLALQKDAQESLRHMNEVVPRIGALYQAALDAQQAYRTFVGHFIDMTGPRFEQRQEDTPIEAAEAEAESQTMTKEQGTQP